MDGEGDSGVSVQEGAHGLIVGDGGWWGKAGEFDLGGRGGERKGEGGGRGRHIKAGVDDVGDWCECQSLMPDGQRDEVGVKCEDFRECVELRKVQRGMVAGYAVGVECEGAEEVKGGGKGADCEGWVGGRAEGCGRRGVMMVRHRENVDGV